MSSKHTTAVIRHGKAVLLLTAVMVTTTGGTVAPEVITKCDAALRCQDSMQGSCNFNWLIPNLQAKREMVLFISYYQTLDLTVQGDYL